MKTPPWQQLAPHLDLQTASPLQRVSHLGLSRPTRPRAAACSPGPPYVQLHNLPAAGRRRGETAAVPARHVCGRSRGRSQERRVAGRSTHGTPSLPAASRLAPASPAECPRPPPLAAAGRRPSPASPQGPLASMAAATAVGRTARRVGQNGTAPATKWAGPERRRSSRRWAGQGRPV